MPKQGKKRTEDSHHASAYERRNGHDLRRRSLEPELVNDCRREKRDGIDRDEEAHVDASLVPGPDIPERLPDVFGVELCRHTVPVLFEHRNNNCAVVVVEELCRFGVLNGCILRHNKIHGRDEQMACIVHEEIGRHSEHNSRDAFEAELHERS